MVFAHERRQNAINSDTKGCAMMQSVVRIINKRKQMKISDKDLHYALWCAEKHTGNSLYSEAMADLEEGILEIEGYEKERPWVKFNPNDVKTFPPSETPVEFIAEAYVDGEILNCLMIGVILQDSPYFIQSGGSQVSYGDVVWWRHLYPCPNY